MLSAIYGKVVNLRNALYDKGVFSTRDLDRRTISVGNITTGGTGKTPLVAYIAEVLANRGEKVCILTRGFGRATPRLRVLVSDGEQLLVDAQKGGDEPVELANRLLGKAIIVADSDRVSAARWALQNFGVTVFLLDDGFQHRKIKRDLDIVCIDATNPAGSGSPGSLSAGRTLPLGRLREPPTNLARADVIVITRTDLAGDVSKLKSEITKLTNGAAIFESHNEISDVILLDEFQRRTRQSSNETFTKQAYAFCGLGNATNFFKLLHRKNTALVGTKAFNDHFVYTQKVIDELCTNAKSCGAEVLVTTAKDAVKMLNFSFEVPCYVVEIEVKIDDEESFNLLLTRRS